MKSTLDTPLRVEQALRLVPELDALEPLRGLLVSASRVPESKQWASAAPYLTVGKRTLWPLDVRQRRRQVLQQFTQHLSSLYESVLQVLEGEQRGDFAAAVRALLGAGETEERVGRLSQARTWYELALSLTRDFQDRKVEFEALRRLGHVCAVVGEYAEAGRYYRRGLTLAEAMKNTECIMLACQNLGRLEFGMGLSVDSESWFSKGLALAESESDLLHTAQFHRDLSAVAQRRGDVALAIEQLQRARQMFEELGATEDLAFTLNSHGLLNADMGLYEEAVANYRAALSWLRQSGQNLWLEVSIRIHLADAFTEMTRLPQAIEQLREAEEIAIVHSFNRGLAQVYTAMGKVSLRQVDENGFVFFEKALELCRGPQRSQELEARILYEYGVFRSRMGDRDEAHALLDRARMAYDAVGDKEQLRLVQAELDRIRG